MPTALERERSGGASGELRVRRPRRARSRHERRSAQDTGRRFQPRLAAMSCARARLLHWRRSLGQGDSASTRGAAQSAFRAQTARFVETDQFDSTSPVLFAKRYPFPFDPNQIYIPRRLIPQRGVSRSSRTRDGMRWTRQRRARMGNRSAAPTGLVSDQAARRRTMLLRTVKPCGPGVQCYFSCRQNER